MKYLKQTSNLGKIGQKEVDQIFLSIRINLNIKKFKLYYFISTGTEIYIIFFKKSQLILRNSLAIQYYFYARN